MFDAISGEGLSIAFHEASALVRCAAADELPKYAKEHQRITRFYRYTVSLLLVVADRPGIRKRMLYALGKSPKLFRYMLGLNDGFARPTLAMLFTLPKFAFHFLFARD